MNHFHMKLMFKYKFNIIWHCGYDCTFAPTNYENFKCYSYNKLGFEPGYVMEWENLDVPFDNTVSWSKKEELVVVL